MLSKFELSTDTERLANWSNVAGGALLKKRQNERTYSHRSFPVLRLAGHTANREIAWMREGLIPSYAHDEDGAEQRNETQAEALTTSASFRCAFRRRRCIVPADAFNECLHEPGGVVLPCSFSLVSGNIFGIAGVWEHWSNDAGHEVESFAIITGLVTSPLMSECERLPIVIPEDQQQRWLARDDIDVLPIDLLRTLSMEELQSWKLTRCRERVQALLDITHGKQVSRANLLTRSG
jgi:putative SOS response-associated peptidase YedK